MVKIKKLVSLPKLFLSTILPSSEDIVLVSEEREGKVVKDNGYSFVKYCYERNYLKGTIYLVTREYCDGLSREYQVLDNSLNQFLLSRRAKLVLYTHQVCFAFPSGMRLSEIAKLKFNAWHLQHGVHYFKRWDNRYDALLERKYTKLCLAYTEYDLMAAMDKKIASLNIGQPRWDYLSQKPSNSGKKVLFAPTWRRSLFYGSNRLKYEYNEMIDYVIDSLEGYDVELKVHRYAEAFLNRKSSRLHYDELLAECDILVTDYSSVFADFQVMGKPVYLYAPDEDMFDKEDVGLLNKPSESVIDTKLNGIFPQMKQVIAYAGGACEELYTEVLKELQ